MDESLAHPPVECVGCGKPFPYDPSRPNKRRCRSGCGRGARSQNPARVRKGEKWHKAREAQRENHELEFIGVDGEGIDKWVYVESYPDPPEYVEVWNDKIGRAHV